MITKADIEKYFIAEKQESILFMCIGIAAIIIALLGIFLWKTQYWKGAAIPLIIVGIIQIVVGYTVFAKSDDQRIDAVYKIDMNPQDLVQNEIPRMEKVNNNFVIYRWAEIVLLIAGFILVFMFRSNTEKQFLFGLAFALAIQAAICLGLDFFAEKRATVYTEQLKTLTKKS